MKAFKFVFAGLVAGMLSFSAMGQDNVNYKITKKGIVKTTVLADSTQEQLTVLKPILIFKGKYEFDTESQDGRFSIRNSRVGVQGDVSKKIAYKFMVDLSDNGSLKVLDLFVTFKPHKRLKFTFGQSSIPLFNSYTLSPNATDFINRPFIGKYFNSSRDMGLTASYTIKQKGFPIAVEAGVYNGDGINNPKWTGTMAYGGRVLFGSMNGWRYTAKAYRTDKNSFEDYLIWGADVRYDNSCLRFEAEYMNKHNYDDIANENGVVIESLSAFYAQGLAKIPVTSKTFKRIEPTLRWDGMGYDFLDRGFGVNRATVGVNLVLKTAVTSLFRINYEHYFNNSMDMSQVFTSPQHCESKLSAEFLLVF